MQRRLKIRTRRVIGKLIGKLSNLLILASTRYRSKAIAFEKIMFAFEERSRRFTSDRVGNLRSESVKEGISIKCNAG